MPRFTLLWPLLPAGLLPAARAAEPVLLRLQQASAEPPLFTVYLTVEGAGEQPLSDLNPIHGRCALDASDRILLGRTEPRISLLGSIS